MALGQMLNGLEASEALDLAALACEVGDGAPQGEVCSTVLGILELRERQVAAGVYDDRPARFVPGLPMVVLAACVARTPGVRMPCVAEPAMDVGERAA